MADTFAQCVADRARTHSGGLRFGDQAWTWAQVVAEAERRRPMLREVSPTPKHPSTDPTNTHQVHLGLLLENIPEFVFWLFAAALEGAVVVGLNTTRRGNELLADLSHSDCDLVLTEEATEPLLQGLQIPIPVRRVEQLAAELPAPTPVTASSVDAAVGPAAGVCPESLLLLLFSSGSTGAPKAVACSQGRLAKLSETLCERVGMTARSISYLCTPMFHGNALMLNLGPALVQGATVVLARRFSATAFVEAIRRHRVTYVNYVGRILAYVLARPAEPGDAESSLELAYGTEASAADIEQFSKRFGCRVAEGYGLSEGVVRINRRPDSPDDSLGAAVCAFPVQVRNAETDQECPPARFDAEGVMTNATEAVGQIVAVGGAVAFEGYYNNPGATAERVRGEDFWTGDLAYRDAEGWFYFAGRANDWLRVDGENLAAGPVERILERHPGVAVAAVYSVPDPRTGDQLMCTLQTDPGFDLAGFADFLAAQHDLSPKAVPRFVRLIGAMPTTGSNKTNKQPLRQQAWRTPDPVWWRPGRDIAFAEFTETDRADWEQQFRDHGRTAVLPAPIQER